MIHLPPSTNAQYRGPLWIAYVATLLTGVGLITGSIHLFKSDGGAFSIAGLNPGTPEQTAIILALFGWAGATQIPFAGLGLLIATRYRTLLPALLLAIASEQALVLLNSRVLHAIHRADGHHPPGVVLAPIACLLPLILAFLASRAPKQQP